MNSYNIPAPQLVEFGFVLSAISNDYAQFWVILNTVTRNLVLRIYAQNNFGKGT